ncbi:MAG TPA: NADH-ubiquinone oxidoreductase-F iron-sulfur binding region domain-containing protein [Candidatus Dormibacteraeota bacterium]|nr:NADH-ubiquinone oxidoreductase-F iron-sulfur binding region domain-containing protein [Candidatus Dormibacteraeota bacterium]
MITLQGPARRLLAGPFLDGQAEQYRAHLARLGPLPLGSAYRELIGEIESSHLLGRGGAGFPVGRKWRAIADRDGGPAVVVANGAEGEIASAKDRVLLAHRPHLVIDGALLAAEAIGAEEVVFYIGSEHRAAMHAVANALRERDGEVGYRLRIVAAPVGYVAGEASAAVNCIDHADPRPTTAPPRPSTSGVHGLPTLVQNVETLAHVALIARFGSDWYRSAGRADSGGTALVTVSGGTTDPRVDEIDLGTTVGELAIVAGVTQTSTRAVILGGYFGTWASVDDVWALPLDPAVMRARGLAFGCGLVGFLTTDRCGVTATAEIMEFMAGASAAQCGPCRFGLRSIADATTRIALGAARPTDLADIERWLPLVDGRGACHHPDGAVQLMASAVAVFGDELARHARTGQCPEGYGLRRAG